jgi:aldehyde dehydrogenase (NAD+)
MQAWKLGPALATGCTVVLKSSEKTPITALMLAKLIKEAGYPPGVVNILSGFGPTCGAFMAKHKNVDKVAFTGSSAVGRLVQKYAAESNLKRVTLELGGKSPLIVAADADLDKAVQLVQLGIFFNSGQVCSASSRIFVHESIYDKFLEKTVEATKKQIITNPSDPKCTVGPIVDKIQFERVMGYIHSGKESGARLLVGGDRQGEKGYFIQPTVFADVKDNMKICQEEIFGPVLSVIKFSTLDEAVKRANATEYGLGAGILSSDISASLRVANSLRAGTVYINCYHYFDPAVPFGGFKMSGVGRELGEYGLSNYTEVKSVIVPL